jgi:glycosyltransferase involved in cell wall biosynthesis
MCARNEEKHIQAAIDSILNQSYHHFELIIIDDASEDATVAIITANKDSRITLLRSEKPLGIAPQANRGLALAKGKYIARMDADDISIPERLAMQVAYLEAHPNCGILGSAIDIINSRGRVKKKGYFPFETNHQAIAVDSLFQSPLMQPTVMIRASAIKGMEYPPTFHCAEDYHLFARIIHEYDAANLPTSLVHYREHPGNSSKGGPCKQHKSHYLSEIYRFQLQHFNIPFNENDILTHLYLESCFIGENFPIKKLLELSNWMAKIHDHLEKQGIRNAREIIVKNWLRALSYHRDKGWPLFKVYYQSPFRRRGLVFCKDLFHIFSHILKHHLKKWM